MKKKRQNILFFKRFGAILFLFWLMVGSVMVIDFWSVELKSKKLYSFVPVPASKLKIQSSEDPEEFSIAYSYEYEGKSYSSDRISPYPFYNARAIKDANFRKWLGRSDKARLIVFVNPENPDEVSVVRGLARDNRIEKLGYGCTIITLGLGLLYLLFRPRHRVQDLF